MRAAMCLLMLTTVMIVAAGEGDVDTLVPEVAEGVPSTPLVTSLSDKPKISDGDFSASELQLLRSAKVLATSEAQADQAKQAAVLDSQQKTADPRALALELQADELKQHAAATQVYQADAALKELQEEEQHAHQDEIHLDSHLLHAKFTTPGETASTPSKVAAPEAASENTQPFDGTKPPGAKSAGGVKLALDAISAELLRRKDRYEVSVKSAQNKLKRDRALSATLKGSLASLIARLAQTKSELKETVAREKREAKKHAHDLKRFQQLSKKEVHHKKMVEVQTSIFKTQQAVKEQTEAFKKSKAQLHKLLKRKRSLEGRGEHHAAASAHQTAKLPPQSSVPVSVVSTAAPMPDPLHGMDSHTQAVMAAVQSKVTTQSVEEELAPKIAQLHSQLSGRALQLAIQRLVTQTVNAKVKTAVQHQAAKPPAPADSEANIVEALRRVARN